MAWTISNKRQNFGLFPLPMMEKAIKGPPLLSWPSSRTIITWWTVAHFAAVRISIPVITVVVVCLCQTSIPYILSDTRIKQRLFLTQDRHLSQPLTTNPYISLGTPKPLHKSDFSTLGLIRMLKFWRTGCRQDIINGVRGFASSLKDTLGKPSLRVINGVCRHVMENEVEDWLPARYYQWCWTQPPAWSSCCLYFG